METRKFIVFVIAACGLISCNQSAGSSSTANKPTAFNQLELDDEPETKKDSDNPRSIKVRVTISRREDLRVKARDKITEGDILADRTRERNALLLQKQQAEMTLDRLEQLARLKAEDLQKPTLPAASFAEAEASIRRSVLLLETAQKNVSLQRERVEKIGGLPFPVDLTAAKEHEAARLRQLERDAAEAKANLELELGKLESARAARFYTEQKDALEIQKQRIAQKSERQQLETQIAQIRAQLAGLETQIAQTQSVRAPFSGTIKKVNWEGQNNAEISVVLTVDVVGDSDAGSDEQN